MYNASIDTKPLRNRKEDLLELDNSSEEEWKNTSERLL